MLPLKGFTKLQDVLSILFGRLRSLEYVNAQYLSRTKLVQWTFIIFAAKTPVTYSKIV